jgi:hypothetical protein
MPGDPVHKGNPVNKPFATGGPNSLQWTNPDDPRATGVELKTRLEKAEEGLKKAKQDLDLKTRLHQAEEGLKKAKQELKARKQKQVKHNRAEEELRVKIETAKRDLGAKEESVAARRARKDAMREEWIKKQTADYEKREVKRQEKAQMQADAQGAEMDGAGMMNTGAAEETVVKEDFDIEFDIDIYGDE